MFSDERCRNLKAALEKLDPIVEQSNIVAFLNNPDQAGMVTSLIEDIRDAIIDYQVCRLLLVILCIMNILADFLTAKHS